MMKSDARKQSREDLHERRKEVVALHLENVPVMQIVERSGLSWYAVNAAIKRYRAAGESALKPSARGRKEGTGRALSDLQESEVLQSIAKLRPGVRRNAPLLWNRLAVAQLIDRNYKITLSERALGNYLVRWGLALKKSKTRPYDRCSREIRTWLDDHYAEIVRQAKEYDAEVYWINKPTRIDSDTWYPKATPNEESPKADVEKPTRDQLSMISVSNNQGKLWWAINNGRVSADQQIRFLNALIRDKKRKRLLVLIRNDQVSFRSQALEKWLEKHIHVLRIVPDAANTPLAADALKPTGVMPRYFTGYQVAE